MRKTKRDLCVRHPQNVAEITKRFEKKLSGAQRIILPHVRGNTLSRLVQSFGTVEGDIEDVVSKTHMPYALLEDNSLYGFVNTIF